MKENNRRKFYIAIILMLVWIAFIWTNSLTIADESSKQSGEILALLNSIFAYLHLDIVLSEFVVRKAAHIFEFMVLSLLCGNVIYQYLKQKLVYNYNILMIHLFICISIASIDESIQLFVPGRAGQIRDVLIDSIGITLGLIFWLVYTKMLNKRV